MYRCYLVRDGRIVMGDDLNVDTFDEAIARGRQLLAAQPDAEEFSGIEIWHRAKLLYSDAVTQTALEVRTLSVHSRRVKAQYSPLGVRPSLTFTRDSVNHHEQIFVFGSG
jgi:hypothetical protein